MSAFAFPWEVWLLLVIVGLVLGLVVVFKRSLPLAPILRAGALSSIALGGLLFAASLLQGVPLDLSGQPVITSPSVAPPLQPRVYDAPPNEVYRLAILTAEAQSSWGQRWRVVQQRPTAISGGVIQVAIPGLGWTETLTANIRPEEGGVQVDAQARSPLGPFAFGGPRRHLAQFLAALDGRVAARQ